MKFAISVNKINIIIMMILICFTTLCLYVFQVQVSNSYMGMKPIAYDFFSVVIVAILMIFLFILIPGESSKPSDIFIGLFIIFCPFSVTFLHGVSGKIDLTSLILLFIFLTMPIIILRIFLPIVVASMKKINLNLLRSKIDIEIFISIFLIAILVLVSQRLDGSFNFNDSYVRRLNARTVLPSGEILSYLFSGAINGVAPYLAFLSGYRKRKVFFIVALSVAFFGFYLVGTKSPICVVLLLGSVGYFLRSSRFSILNMVLGLVLLINILAIVERIVFGFSYIADIFVRRVFAVVPQLQGYYVDYFMTDSSLPELLLGSHWGSQITFAIGEKYLNNPNSNANTNAFLYELGRNGFVGCVLLLVVLVCFYAFLDTLYVKYGKIGAVGASIIYSLLITEQSYSAAMLTSGVLLVLLFVVFEPGRRTV